MAELVLGPMLRHVGERDATVWVETDEACEVEVLGHTEPTFCVDGHHYALVCIEGLEPGSRSEYEVSLDGERRWPVADSEISPPARSAPWTRTGAARLVRLLPRRAADGAAVRLHRRTSTTTAPRSTRSTSTRTS